MATPRDAKSRVSLEGALNPTSKQQPGASGLPAPNAANTAKKVDLSAILGNLIPHPFSYNDFLEFLKKEHSVENIDYWEAGMKYRERALPLFPKPNKSKEIYSTDLTKAMTTSQTGSLKEDETESLTGNDGPQVDEALMLKQQLALKPDLDAIVSLYLTAGSQKEVNLPQNLIKKTIIEIHESKNYHPDVLKPTLEKTYEMMKTCTFPNFYKAAVEEAKKKNLPILENGYARKKAAK